jgi:ribosomal protein S18 acetylase RimI-like enzyme
MKQELIQINDVIIRKAVAEDAAEIANVHLNSWREVYRNLLPQQFLDQLPLTFKRRMSMWKQAATMENRALYVAEEKSGIVGFSVFAPPQDKEMNEHGELGAIYLLEKFKGKKIGAALLSVGMKKLIEWKYSKAYCWVLQDNPTINFYEKSGAIFNGMEKPDEIGGQKVKELCYEWKDLKNSFS